MKKKIVIILLTILLIVPLTVNAKDYSISDYNIEIELGEGWDVFTRDNIYENDNLEKYDITYDYFNNLMKNNFIYMDAVHQSSVEMFIRIKSEAEAVNNLANLEDSLLKEIAQALLKRTGALNYIIIESNGIKYIKSTYYDNKTQLYILEYVTIVNRNDVTFTIQSSDETSISSLETEIDQIIKSATIKIDPNKAKEETKGTFDWGIVLKDTIIGMIVGGVVGLIGYILTKKKVFKS